MGKRIKGMINKKGKKKRRENVKEEEEIVRGGGGRETSDRTKETGKENC